MKYVSGSLDDIDQVLFSNEEWALHDFIVQDTMDGATFFEWQSYLRECPKHTSGGRAVEHARFLRQYRAFSHVRLHLVKRAKQREMVGARRILFAG